MFGKKTIEFLAENRLRNSREWFKENRAVFDEWVFAPLAELVTALAPVMQDIDPQIITEPKTDKTIARVYRDTRFSKDKSLYRDCMWAVFMRDKHIWPGLPGYVFELSPLGFRWGCGWFDAPTDTMAELRRMILEDHPAFLEADACYRRQTDIKMAGETFKRSRYPDAPPEKADWLNRKCMAFMRNSEDFDLFSSPSLAEEVARDFKSIAPIYRFCMLAEESARRAELHS